jgi:tRNA(adenine34) deaminase
MWDMLAPAWQAAFAQAWEAYCAGTVPIGAVVTGLDGTILARGRNRILDDAAPKNQLCGNTLAHAELNALTSLDADQETRHVCCLYTTMEPCPLCLGAFYMSALRTVYFAARDPWAGSINLLGTTPYLKHKPIQAFGPQDARLELISVAIHTDFELSEHGEGLLKTAYYGSYISIHPQAVELGLTLHRTGELQRMSRAGASIAEVVDCLAGRTERMD